MTITHEHTARIFSTFHRRLPIPTKDNRVLVTCATGKCGLECCRALVDAGFDVYGTTRSATSGARIAAVGATPVIANYVTEMPKALQESGATMLLFITDFFKSGGSKVEREYQQGVHAIDAAKAAGVKHAIFISVADADKFPQACTHLLAKPMVEEYLKKSGLKFSILGASTFFENFDDAANFNPLKKGSLSFLMTESVKYCATYDIGRAAVVQFRDTAKWSGKKLDVVGWEGDLDAAAAALERVGGFPVKRSLAMPLFLRKLFLSDLDAMCNYFISPGFQSDPADFKKHVPDALDAEGWFRHHNQYGNGEPIVGNKTPPSSATRYLVPLAVAVVGTLVFYAQKR